jgi:diguanylate cyclase (GGDEF)-like protein/PAS domain S-box-containing protein
MFHDTHYCGIQAASGTNHAPASVLVLGDETDDHTKLTRMLQNHGYQIRTATTQAVALCQLQRTAFDVILLAFSQPQASALENLRWLARHHIDSERIVLSANASLAEVTSAFKSGARDFLAHPCRDEELLQALAEACQKQRRQHQDSAQPKPNDSQAFLNTLLNAIPLPLFYKDRQGRYLGCNKAFEAFRGITEKNLIGKTVFDTSPPELASIHCAKDQALFGDGKQQKYELEVKNSHDELRQVVFYKSVFVDQHGHVDGLIGTLLDITEHKHNENDLLLAASVFTHAREGITITDTKGQILRVNDAFTRITGYSREEALGQNPRLLKSGRHDAEFYTAIWQQLDSIGHWSGEIWNRRKNGEVYPELLTISKVPDAQGKTQHYVALFTDIAAQKEYQRQLEYLAHYDPLTHLPNRVLLAARLEQSMRQSKRHGLRLAVAYLDLDGFKRINDMHGHDIGDQFLIAVAKRMQETLRESDIIARLGGDEFVAVLNDLSDNSDSTHLLNRLLAAATQPLVSNDWVLQASASIGVSFYPQGRKIDPDQLLRQADQAMYRAKADGKNCFRIFDPEKDHTIDRERTTG